jgi:hypothetical protein
MLILPLQQFREHCDGSPDVVLLWCLTFNAVDSREQNVPNADGYYQIGV